MFEFIFAVIGVISVIYFLYILTREARCSIRYNSLCNDLERVYYKIKGSEKKLYSKDDVQDIIGLLHNRTFVNPRYFEEEV